MKVLKVKNVKIKIGDQEFPYASWTVGGEPANFTGIDQEIARQRERVELEQRRNAAAYLAACKRERNARIVRWLVFALAVAALVWLVWAMPALGGL